MNSNVYSRFKLHYIVWLVQLLMNEWINEYLCFYHLCSVKKFWYIMWRQWSTINIFLWCFVDNYLSYMMSYNDVACLYNIFYSMLFCTLIKHFQLNVSLFFSKVLLLDQSLKIINSYSIVWYQVTYDLVFAHCSPCNYYFETQPNVIYNSNS